MDMEFVVQDTYSLLRPNWKLVLNDLNEAGSIFAEACKQNYRDVASGKTPEPEEPEEELDAEGDLSDDGQGDGEDVAAVDGDAANAKTDSDDAAQGDDDMQADDSDEEEHIVVTRPEDQRDPEADAEFDRELAKLMAESVESRKFDRKTMFDVPLPMRRTAREAPAAAVEQSNEAAPASQDGAGTMKFALLSKKGNRQQVCIDVLMSLVASVLLINPRHDRSTFRLTPISPLLCDLSSKLRRQSNNASRIWC
jgi:regulator of nonsense transcripts 2